MKIEITEFNRKKHQKEVIDLWNQIFAYHAPHNAPELIIEKKVSFNDGLFFVALKKKRVIGTIMAGYDGRRGWIYAMVVAPDNRNQGIGSLLLSFAEQKLQELGCLKVNLQIMEDNQEVEEFYHSKGYRKERRISMGKRLYHKNTQKE